MTPMVTPNADLPGDSSAMSIRCWVRLLPSKLSKRGSLELLISITEPAIGAVRSGATSGAEVKLAVSETHAPGSAATPAPAPSIKPAHRHACGSRDERGCFDSTSLGTAVFMKHLQR